MQESGFTRRRITGAVRTLGPVALCCFVTASGCAEPETVYRRACTGGSGACSGNNVVWDQLEATLDDLPFHRFEAKLLEEHGYNVWRRFLTHAVPFCEKVSSAR